MKDKGKRYLGDGVYVEQSASQMGIILSVERSVEVHPPEMMMRRAMVKHWIFLDPRMIDQLNLYVKEGVTE